MRLFNERKKVNGKTQVPVWFMRQAGRYHSHYQAIRKQSNFMEMCKDEKLATEITMGPIRDFRFDAAILFSDLLFPLENLNLGLSYESGPPTLELKLSSPEDLTRLKNLVPAESYYQFQAKALTLLRAQLDKEEGPDLTLLGFVGGPFTLYAYAVEGSHSGALVSSKTGLHDGRYSGLMKKLLPEVVTQMKVQAAGGASAICVLDTAAGELCHADFKEFLLPELKNLVAEFKKDYPNVPVIYYSKMTHMHYLESTAKSLGNLVTGLGVDWRMDLGLALNTFGKDYYIQGNIDPSWLHLPWSVLEKNLNNLWDGLQKQSIPNHRWIMGLGHGVVIQTPEENVRNAVKLVHERFVY